MPANDRTLNLSRIREALESQGIPVVDARVLLVADLGVEATISRRGRLLFKTPDERAADEALARLVLLVPELASLLA